MATTGDVEPRDEGDQSQPHTFKLQRGDCLIYFFGERHTFNPNHPQWARHRALWDEFIRLTAGKPRVVFVEGALRKLEPTLTDAVARGGGPGLVTYLAAQEGIEVLCPEPEQREERADLERRFAREEIELFYFARSVHQWRRRPQPRPDFGDWAQQFFSRERALSGWTDFSFTLEAMEGTYFKLFKVVFDENDEKFLYGTVNPLDRGTILNEVSRASTEVRDTYLVKKIQELLLSGSSIFIQYGRYHALTLEPVLGKLLR